MLSGQLFEKGHLRGRERTDGGELDNGLDWFSNKTGSTTIFFGLTRSSAELIGTASVGYPRPAADACPWPLTDQALAELHELRMRVGSVARIGRQQVQLRMVLILDLVDEPMWAFTSGVNSVRSSRPMVVRSRWPCSMLVNLARLVFSQSCSVFHVGGQTQIADHGVDVVFELGDFAARHRPGSNGLRSPLVTAVATLGDGAHLRGQIGGQQVDVAGQIFPGAGGARHVRLPPSRPSTPTSRATLVT